MAHDADALFYEVYLYPAGRQQEGRGAHVCQCHGGVFGERHLAWGELDFYFVGRGEWAWQSL